jgi:hypothetical protein
MEIGNGLNVCVIGGEIWLKNSLKMYPNPVGLELQN